MYIQREIENNISWKKAKSTITEALNDCIGTWCSKYDR